MISHMPKNGLYQTRSTSRAISHFCLVEERALLELGRVLRVSRKEDAKDEVNGGAGQGLPSRFFCLTQQLLSLSFI